MKEKIKGGLVALLIIYSVSVIVLMINSFVNTTYILEISDDERYTSRLNELKKELPKVKDVTCRNAIKRFVDYYELSSYDEKYDLRDESYLYQYDYLSAVSDCNIEDGTFREKLDNEYVLMTKLHQDLIGSYLYQYEISLNDNLIRTNYGIQNDEATYLLNRNATLDLISDFIEYSKGGTI